MFPFCPFALEKRFYNVALSGLELYRAEGCPTPRQTCPCLISAGNKDICHHAWPYPGLFLVAVRLKEKKKRKVNN